MWRPLAVLLLLIAAMPAHADDAAIQNIYAAMEKDVHREYSRLQDAIARGATGGPGAESDKTQQFLKSMFYNRATLFAYCAAEAEENRSDTSGRVPAGQNIFLTACVEPKFAALNKFANLLSYAGAFFPDRIESCGEAVRLRDHEKLLPPYAFLELAEPKLYDFTRYNECLMPANRSSPVAQ
jgi:hypothetical protein